MNSIEFFFRLPIISVSLENTDHGPIVTSVKYISYLNDRGNQYIDTKQDSENNRPDYVHDHFFPRDKGMSKGSVFTTRVNQVAPKQSHRNVNMVRSKNSDMLPAKEYKTNIGPNKKNNV